MKKLLLSLSFAALTVTSTSAQLYHNFTQAKQTNSLAQIGTNDNANLRFLKNKSQLNEHDQKLLVKANEQYAHFLQQKINWDQIVNNAQTSLVNKSEQLITPNLKTDANNLNLSLQTNYQTTPFDGVNKVEWGVFITRVYISENLLNFVMEKIINYRHQEVEVATEGIVATLLLIGLRAPAAILGAIAGILYWYFEVLSAVDEGQGVGVNLLMQVVLWGVWAQ